MLFTVGILGASFYDTRRANETALILVPCCICLFKILSFLIRLLLSVPKAGPDRYQLYPEEEVVKGYPEVAISAVTPSDPAHVRRPATQSSIARGNQYNMRRTREDSQPMGNSGSERISKLFNFSV